MNKIHSVLFILFCFSLVLSVNCKKEESGLPRDGDGNTYDTVEIGNQTWLRQNLRTTKYLNGVSVPLVTDYTEWTSMNSPGFCWYNNQPEELKEEYGALYNGWAANVSYLCPDGYHVPTKDDWDVLISHLGGENVAGGKLKMTGNTYWQDNSFATNESGFSAVGGGVRDHNSGSFNSIRNRGVWWVRASGYNYLEIVSMDGNVHLGGLTSKAGFSVRCLKNK